MHKKHLPTVSLIKFYNRGISRRKIALRIKSGTLEMTVKKNGILCTNKKQQAPFYFRRRAGDEVLVGIVCFKLLTRFIIGQSVVFHL